MFRSQAASDEFLLDLTNDQADEVLISLGWEKVLRKEYLMLYRRFDHDLQIHIYKSSRISFFVAFRCSNSCL